MECYKIVLGHYARLEQAICCRSQKGSKHNRGCAADLTLYDLKTGKEIEMTGVYDEMSERSYPYYTGGTEQQRKMRDLLRTSMESEDFKVYEYEWWHFDYKDWTLYRIGNIPFSKNQVKKKFIVNKVACP